MRSRARPVVGRALVPFGGRARRNPRPRGGVCPAGNLWLRIEVPEIQGPALRPPAGPATTVAAMSPRSNMGVASRDRRTGSMYSIFAAKHRWHFLVSRKWRKPGRKVVQVQACVVPCNNRAPEVETISSLARNQANRAGFDLTAPRRYQNQHVKQALPGNHFLKVSA